MPDRDNLVHRDDSHSSQPVETGELAGKHAFVEPKLTFVKPRLVRQGRLEEKTQSFFGPFTP
jgi:hypothetical protein